MSKVIDFENQSTKCFWRIACSTTADEREERERERERERESEKG
jgi:hypothetical protein